MTRTTISTVSGRFNGQIRNAARCWLGIRYGRVPSRWQQPEAQAPHRFARDCSFYRRPALQHSSAMGAQIPGGFHDGVEDALTLNVFAPLETVRRCPVMVWIHGGGFAVGSASQSWYDGSTLAREHNVLVVTINYRVGVLGFLRLNDITDGRIPATGNEGLLDQIAALEWIQRHIDAFGGDPDNVTIFGESAGAMSISSLMTMPAAEGLAHKAIMQSGNMHAAHSIDNANRVASEFLKALPASVRTNPIKASKEALTDAAATLHGRLMFDERLTIMPTRPVVDGESLPMLPIQAMRDGHAAKIPVIIGYNKDEWRYFAQVDRAMKRLDDAGLRQRLAYHFRPNEVERLLELYAYDPTLERAGFLTYSRIHSDASFIASSKAAIEALASRQPVYAYRFDRPAPGLGGLLGACHVTEIPYVFGTLDQLGHGVLFENSDVSRGLSRDMRQWWCNFARSGEPDFARWPAWQDHPGEWLIDAEQVYANHSHNDIDSFWATISDERRMQV
ncbi:MAG: carboxylesterase family protein [Pseudomonadota bacterium]